MSQADFNRVSRLEERVRLLEGICEALAVDLEKLKNQQRMAIARAGKEKPGLNVLAAG